MPDGSEKQSEATRAMDACLAAITEGELTDPRPPVLYHLTDSDGLFGIFTTKTLWASLATAMNDALEVGHGLRLAKKLLGERLRRRTTEYDVALLHFLKTPAAAPPGIRFEMFPLITSFCARCDKSGQWLHYGRSGHGIAIGFAPTIAERVSFELIKVDYSPESQQSRMHRLIDAGPKLIDAVSSSMTIDRQIQLARMTAHIVSLYVPQLAVRMKHQSFYEEDEWRLVGHIMSLNGVRQNVTGDATPLKYRRSNQRLVPYEELILGEHAQELVKEVVVGFSSEIGPDAIQLLAQEQKLTPTVRRSEVPVR